MSSIDLDQVIRQYLAQWAHVGCGGQPITLPQYNALGCSLCAARWPWTRTLGAAVQAVLKQGVFRSLVIK